MDKQDNYRFPCIFVRAPEGIDQIGQVLDGPAAEHHIKRLVLGIKFCVVQSVRRRRNVLIGRRLSNRARELPRGGSIEPRHECSSATADICSSGDLLCAYHRQ